MQFLRRLSLSRLLALCAAVVIVGAAGTALASSIGGASPPAAQPLAQAIHAALSAPQVQGVSAQITFTNSLLDGASLQSAGSSGLLSGANPLMGGASGRLWASGGEVRLELQSAHGDDEIVDDGHQIELYETASNNLYRYRLPGGSSTSGSGGGRSVPTVAHIANLLSHLSRHHLLSGATPGVTAGQPSYTVRVTPRQDGGLFGGVALSWDAARGVPLALDLYATGNASPVLSLRATSISYGPVSPSVFALDPPDPIVHDVTVGAGGGRTASGARDRQAPVTGASAVGGKAPFALHAPVTLSGQSLDQVRLVHLHGRPGALLTYGHGLGGLAILEQAAGAPSLLPTTTSTTDPNSSLGVLPHVDVDGVSASELAAALGTLLSWTTDGIQYTLLGSVPKATAVQAANGF
ncbi:MAG TPA: hypothetical protein VHX88_10940 [Solirubrobacteraceae bacterium]|jgi:hypothetical protein|nr:hypothetical protein [Solirubrobacteraceae bacterium]